MSKVEWLCSRCADKEDKETEPDPVVLRLCTSCKVQNWVRPFAHAGEAMEPTPEEVEEALAFHKQKLKVLKKATSNRKAKEAEDYKEAERQVLEAETVEPATSGILLSKDGVGVEEAETVTVSDTSGGEVEIPAEEPSEKEKEIAALKAQLAELEK